MKRAGAGRQGAARTRWVFGATVAAAGAAALFLVRRRGRAGLRLRRGIAALRLAARGGARYASSAPRLFAAAGENRERLRTDLALQTAEEPGTGRRGHHRGTRPAAGAGLRPLGP